MDREYATQGQASRLGDVGGRVAATTAVEQPSLHALCDRLEKQMAVLIEGVSRTRQFSQRLLDPRPEQVGKDSSAVPQPQTVEARLRHILHTAENIGHALHGVATELDRAA